MITEFDHLVVGCATLEQGIDHFEALLGVAPVAGGRHAPMGTHNAVLKLGDRRYIELLAIDPQASAPQRPRWFDLDTEPMQAALAQSPRLIGWAARTDDLDDALLRCTVAAGVAHPMTRGDFAWRITIPEDGVRPEAGVLPTLIRWQSEVHPADRMPPSGVTLAQFAASHPSPDLIREALAALKLDGVLRVTYGATPRLAAMLRTPRGVVAL